MKTFLLLSQCRFKSQQLMANMHLALLLSCRHEYLLPELRRLKCCRLKRHQRVLSNGHLLFQLAFQEPSASTFRTDLPSQAPSSGPTQATAPSTEASESPSQWPSTFPSQQRSMEPTNSAVPSTGPHSFPSENLTTAMLSTTPSNRPRPLPGSSPVMISASTSSNEPSTTPSTWLHSWPSQIIISVTS